MFENRFRAVFQPRPWLYGLWLLILLLMIAWGVEGYNRQWRQGLVMTGMTDQVLWGVYIANFIFLVGVAASAVLLVIPAYLLDWPGAKRVVLFGEVMAIAAVVMSLLFVLVDLGQPMRIWHALPFIGRLNFPHSILAWDMVILTTYLLLNLGLVSGWLWHRSRGRTALPGHYFFGILMAIILGIGIHTVTAFMLSGLPARPFWHSSSLAPRFLASAFASGSGVLILFFWILEKTLDFKQSEPVIRLLTSIMTLALLIDLFLMGSEWFVLFYHPTIHGESGKILFLGQGLLTPWIWSAFGALCTAAILLLIRPKQVGSVRLYGACLLIIPAILVEKGVGMVIPGLQPTPLGEFVIYVPTLVEFQVTAGIWAFGLLLFTLLVRLVVKVEGGEPPIP